MQRSSRTQEHTARRCGGIGVGPAQRTGLFICGRATLRYHRAMSSKLFAAAAALAICCTSAGCGGITDPSQNANEPFSGVLNHGDPIHFHPFTSSKTGEISAKFTSLTPVSNVIM